MIERELKAIIYLLNDPDTEIYQQLEDQLISKGGKIVPFLEEEWESSTDSLTQERLLKIIHIIQFDQIKSDLQIWLLQNSEDLLEGLTIINRYQYPNIEDDSILHQIAELRSNVWFRMMYEMTPVEKVKLLNYMLFREFGLSGNTEDYHSPNNSFISKVLESKKGNPISLSCIYSIVAQKLDIPIYGINLPKHFVTAYMDELTDEPLFYINIFNKGQIMQKEDIYSFLKQMNLPSIKEYTLPCNNVDIIKRTLKNLITAYEGLKEEEKRKEIEILLKLVEEY